MHSTPRRGRAPAMVCVERRREGLRRRRRRRSPRSARRCAAGRARRPGSRPSCVAGEQALAAVAGSSSNTGCASATELLITRSTSAVAVCCSSASLRLVEQPHVLDRDHRLVGEGLQQLDLVRRRTAPARARRDADRADAPGRRAASARTACCGSRAARASSRISRRRVSASASVSAICTDRRRGSARRSGNVSRSAHRERRAAALASASGVGRRVGHQVQQLAVEARHGVDHARRSSRLALRRRWRRTPAARRSASR